MKIINKQYFDILSASPGKYIFQNKSNKIESGKISLLLYILLSILLFIYVYIHIF